MPEALLTMRNLCDRLQVTRFTVRRWYKAGLIPKPIRVNRTLRWDADELDAALKASGPALEPAAHAVTA